ncbi:MAG TPA: rhodanese-like domain-containing protein [Woeseiaceae bacterium]|nr:rhodanese-like domain-containing protein [Woeseiaceae bacterium]
MFEEISPAGLAACREDGEPWLLLDVREPWEIEIASVPGATCIPLAELAARYTELDAGRPLAVLCHSGGRSARAAAFLTAQGFSRVANVYGGIDAWSRQVDTSIPRY